MVYLLGLRFSLLAFLEASFGYIFSVSTVLPSLLFSSFYAHFIKRWYTRKGVRLKPEKEPNELEILFRSSGAKLLQRNSNQVFWKAAGTPEENISVFSVMSSVSAAFLVLAVMLGDGGKRISRLDVDAGIRSGSWVGGAERGSQWHHWGGSCYINGRSGLKGRIDFSFGNAGNWIENAPPGTGSWRRRMQTAAAAVAAAAAATVAAAKAVARAAKAKAATAMANAAAAVGIRILSRNRLTVAGTDVGRKEVTVGVKGTAATMDRDAV
jgi:hypothetical protein